MALAVWRVRAMAMIGIRALIGLPALAILAACATTGGPRTPGDPYESINRKVWALDEKLDKAVLKPVAKGYIAVLPMAVRRSVTNIFSNLSEPFSAVNSLLQAKPRRALNSVGRFLINSTVGIAGIRDVAIKSGYKKTPEDLGQTFAVWGAKKSSYLVLPLFGPSTIRDGIGTLGSQFVDPYRIVLNNELSFWPNIGVSAVSLVDARANLIDSGADSLLESSADTYAVTRSAYLQRRDALIADRDDDAIGGGGDDAALDAALKDLDSGDDMTIEPGTPPPTLSPDQTPPATPRP